MLEMYKHIQQAFITLMGNLGMQRRACLQAAAVICSGGCVLSTGSSSDPAVLARLPPRKRSTLLAGLHAYT